jgi:DNA-binding response OmpR family regulator
MQPITGVATVARHDRGVRPVKVLLVEDELHVAASLKVGLRAEGFVVVHADTGTEGFWQAVENRFDVIILDIMLPGPSGYEVLRRIRERKIWTPVLMLTAKDGEYDQADAFDLGADDYLVKPFSFVVLVARLRALIRRGAPQRPVVMAAGDLVLDPSRHLVTRAGVPIDLSPREFGVLEFLMRNTDVVCTKAQIVQNVWDEHFSGPENVVEVYIGYLRRKIDVPFGTNTIETVWGVGYRLESGNLASGN